MGDLEIRVQGGLTILAHAAAGDPQVRIEKRDEWIAWVAEMTEEYRTLPEAVAQSEDLTLHDWNRDEMLRLASHLGLWLCWGEEHVLSREFAVDIGLQMKGARTTYEEHEEQTAARRAASDWHPPRWEGEYQRCRYCEYSYTPRGVLVCVDCGASDGLEPTDRPTHPDLILLCPGCLGGCRNNRKPA